MKIEITEDRARELFEQGHPVGFEMYDSMHWVSAATGSYGIRSFDGVGEIGQWFKDPSRKTHDEAAGHIFRREEFRIGNLSGSYNLLPEGDLPKQYRVGIKDIATKSGVRYVVRSYETPIAWVEVTGEIVVPPVRYSHTTTQHQYLAARALGVNFHATDDSFRKGKGRSPYGPRAGW